MEAPLVLEILDRFGKVRERHRLEQFPVRIGRGYDNDIILDDPYVSPRHIELMVDGNGHVMVADLKSENGLFSLHPLQRHELLTVADNQRFRIGHTDLRLRSIDFPVRETFIDRIRPRKIHLLFTNAVMLPVFLLLSAAVFSVYYYEQSFHDVTVGNIVSQVLPLFIFIFLWSVVWSIVSKVVTHKFYFSYHAILTSVIMSAFYLIDPLFGYLEFVYPINGLADNLSLALDLVLPIALIYGNLRQSTTLGKRNAGITAILASLLVIGIMHLSTYLNQPDFTAEPQYSQVLKAPMFNPRRGQSIDKFFANTQSLSEFAIKQDEPSKRSKP